MKRILFIALFACFMSFHLNVGAEGENTEPVVEEELSFNDEIDKFFEEMTGIFATVLFYEVKVKFSGVDLDEFEVKSFPNLVKYLQESVVPSGENNEAFADFKFDPETIDLIQKYSYFNPPSEDLLKNVSTELGVSAELCARNNFELMSFLSKPLAFERAQVVSMALSSEMLDEIKNFSGSVSAKLKSYICSKFNINSKKKNAETLVLEQVKRIQVAIIIVGNFEKLSVGTLQSLKDYNIISKVDDLLKTKIVTQLNESIVSKPKIRNQLEDAGLVIPHQEGIPLIVMVLALGGIIFTFTYKFIGWQGIKHSFDVIRGRYDDKDDSGEITHFQALTSALSATVGLGNIAMVAVAVCAGGPGVVFWMWATAAFGMASKFSSCMLAQVYREVGPDGKVKGGPMYYLDKGIKDLYPSLGWLGKVFAVIFSVFCIAGSFGGGNTFQGNQTYQMFSSTFQMEGPFYEWLVGIIMAVGAGLVIIGGIKKIGKFTSRLVPFMVVFYVGTCLLIIFKNFGEIGSVFSSIFTEAFSAKSAMWGGFIFVFVNGVKRAAFSNEAGLGSAAIAHAAAKTDEPVREGIVAMIGPFIDTIIICTITAVTVLITHAHESGAEPGVQITSVAFATVHWSFPYMLALAVFFFSFSTVISWSYYGERCTDYLFGEKSVTIYRIFYVIAIALGPVLSLQAIIDFSDMMLLSMAFPNIIGSILLAKKGKLLFNDYWSRYKSGEMKPDK